MDETAKVMENKKYQPMPLGCTQFCVAAVSQKLLPYNIIAF
jgi:hypothetical protein